MNAVRCSGCGAEVPTGSDRCPLCGADPTIKAARRTKAGDVENYQSNVRELREELKKLRDKGAEAV